MNHDVYYDGSSSTITHEEPGRLNKIHDSIKMEIPIDFRPIYN